MSEHRPIALGIAAVAAVIAVVLGTVQIASMSAYGDLATPHSFPAMLFSSNKTRLRAVFGDGYAAAAADLHDRDLAGAARRLATLPRDSRADALRGELAAAEGDAGGALRWYLVARDAVRAQASVDALGARDRRAALPAQRRLVATFDAADIPGDQLADAWWRLGTLERAAGDAAGPGAAREAEAALDSFERALGLAPNRKSYLLAAGIQALKLGRLALAQRLLARAVEVGPGNANAYGALALAEAGRDRCAAARSARAAWQERSPAGARPPEADPQFGARLRACEAGFSSLHPNGATSGITRLRALRRSAARAIHFRSVTRRAAHRRQARAVARPASAATAAPVCRIFHVSISPASVRSFSRVTGMVETSEDVRSVAVSVGHLRPVHLSQTAPGRFEGSIAVPWIPWFLHRTYTVTFTGYDLRGHADSSSVMVDVH